MSVFLRLHGDAVAGDEGLREALEVFRGEMEKEGGRMGELVGFCGGVVGFLRNPR